MGGAGRMVEWVNGRDGWGGGRRGESDRCRIRGSLIQTRKNFRATRQTRPYMLCITSCCRIRSGNHTRVNPGHTTLTYKFLEPGYPHRHKILSTEQLKQPNIGGGLIHLEWLDFNGTGSPTHMAKLPHKMVACTAMLTHYHWP